MIDEKFQLWYVMSKKTDFVALSGINILNQGYVIWNMQS